jgi:hypothetical protein
VVVVGCQVVLHSSKPQVETSWLRLDVSGFVDDDYCPVDRAHRSEDTNLRALDFSAVKIDATFGLDYVESWCHAAGCVIISVFEKGPAVRIVRYVRWHNCRTLLEIIGPSSSVRTISSGGVIMLVTPGIICCR